MNTHKNKNKVPKNDDIPFVSKYTVSPDGKITKNRGMGNPLSSPYARDMRGAEIAYSIEKARAEKERLKQRQYSMIGLSRRPRMGNNRRESRARNVQRIPEQITIPVTVKGKEGILKVKSRSERKIYHIRTS
jgi:hypothetical protein